MDWLISGGKDEVGVVGVVLRPGLEARRLEPLLLLLGVRAG